MSDTGASQDSPSASPDLMSNLLNGVRNSAKNLDDFQSGVRNLIAGAVGQTQAAAAASNAATAAKVQAIQQGSAADQTVAQAEGEAKLKKQTDDSIAAQELGVDKGGLAARTAAIADIKAKITGIDTQLEQKSGQTWYNDPIGSLENVFAVPRLENQRRELSNEYNHQTGFLKDDQAASLQQNAINESLDTATGTTLIAAQKASIAAKATAAAAEANIDASKFNISAITALTNLNVSQFDVAYKGLTAQESVLASAREAAQADYYTAATPGKAIRAKIEADQLAERSVQEADAKFGNTFSGGAIPSTVAGLAAEAPGLKAVHQEIISNAKTFGSIGFDPVNSLELSQRGGLNPVTGGDVATRNFIDKSANLAATTFQPRPGTGATFKSLTPQQQHFYMQQGVEADVNHALKDVSQPGTPYSTPLYSTALKLPGIASTDIGQALAPRVTTAGTVNGTDLVGTALDLIDKKGMTPGAAAAQLEIIAKNLQVATNVGSSLQKYALPQMGQPATPGYNMSVKTAGGVKTLDFANRAASEAFLTRLVNSGRFVDTTNSGNHFGVPFQ